MEKIELTDQQISEKLEQVLKKHVWPQADSINAYPTKTGKYKIEFSNDYPLQHGSGESYVIPLDLAKYIASL